MTLVDSFGQAYHWTMDYILSLTLPQIIMINAGAGVNKKRMDKRISTNRSEGKTTLEERMQDVVVWKGKKLTELDSVEYLQYHASAGGGM
jgi:hypothetical protein